MKVTLRAVIFALLTALALSQSSCKTFANANSFGDAFASQLGRNIADSLWDK